MKGEHGGALDAAIARYGGARADWLDLSTGINPVPYPLPPLADGIWTALPDSAAAAALIGAARRFWGVPDGAAILAAPGASALIAALPGCLEGRRVRIPGPTYSEHAAAFVAAGWTEAEPPEALVLVHPNNPDGRLWPRTALAGAAQVVIDESFCDVEPAASHVAVAAEPGRVILKSFGKFWGLAGLRLGFAIGEPRLIGRLARRLGPWPVSGPALAIGTAALSDPDWAAATRARLRREAERLDRLAAERGLVPAGGTALFRLFDDADAAGRADRLARARILVRTFRHLPGRLRLGLPPPSGWARLEAEL